MGKNIKALKSVIISIILIALCMTGCTYTPDTVQCTVCAVQGTDGGYDTVYVRDTEWNVYTYKVCDIDSMSIQIGDVVNVTK